MDTFTTYEADAASDFIKLALAQDACFTTNDREVELWIDVTRRFSDLHQLYELYLWNYEQLVHGIGLLTNDTVKMTVDNGTQMDDLIIVNGYAVNLISAGSNLIEALRSTASHLKSAAPQVGLVFSDRFLIMQDEKRSRDSFFCFVKELRNFAQHGQLIASLYEDESGAKRVCFDAHQLLQPASYKTKSWFKQFLMEFIEQVQASGHLPARISFTYAIDAFHSVVCEQYCLFLRSYEDTVKELVKIMTMRMREDYKTLLSADSKIFSIYYDEPEVHIMAGHPNEFLKVYSDYISAAERFRKAAKHDFDVTKSHYREVSSIAHG